MSCMQSLLAINSRRRACNINKTQIRVQTSSITHFSYTFLNPTFFSCLLCFPFSCYPSFPVHSVFFSCHLFLEACESVITFPPMSGVKPLSKLSVDIWVYSSWAGIKIADNEDNIPEKNWGGRYFYPETNIYHTLFHLLKLQTVLFNMQHLWNKLPHSFHEHHPHPLTIACTTSF